MRAPAPVPQPAHITPEQALANTRALLEAKQQRAHEAPTYPADDPVHHARGTPATPGVPAGDQERHFAEANQPAILGHVAATTRSNQSKRDRR